MEHAYDSLPANVDKATDRGGQQQSAARGSPPIAGARLDLKALRLAVHGWWLGNPLVYKPGVSDLHEVAHKLASAGVASGTLIVGDVRDLGDAASDAAPSCGDVIQAILILRTSLPRALIGQTAATSVANVAQSALGFPCAVERQWDVVVSCDHPQALLCHVSASGSEKPQVTFLDLRFALQPLWSAAGEGSQPAVTLLARSDWREVFLARVLHTLDSQLQPLVLTEPDAECGAK